MKKTSMISTTFLTLFLLSPFPVFHPHYPPPLPVLNIIIRPGAGAAILEPIITIWERLTQFQEQWPWGPHAAEHMQENAYGQILII